MEANDKKGFEWIEKAAMKGEAAAQYQLCFIYYEGKRGIKQDYEKSFE
ncbi:MAG: SEL1-like repeat protein, partial [Rickettsiales bacterium]|nr:SEL1-like repeat protein [Rickettsiales bacterium]